MGTVRPDHSNISDRQLRAVIDTIPALVWLANTEGAAEYLNRRWLEYTGLTQAQAVGWGWTVAVHPEDIDRLTNYWRKCSAVRRSRRNGGAAPTCRRRVWLVQVYGRTSA